MQKLQGMYEITPDPCPFCGSEDLVGGYWCIDDNGSHDLVTVGDSGEVPSIECNRCLGSAPVENWNKRPTTWHYPPEMPAEDQQVLITYLREDSTESSPILHTYQSKYAAHIRPIVKWMSIPKESSL